MAKVHVENIGAYPRPGGSGWLAAGFIFDKSIERAAYRGAGGQLSQPPCAGPAPLHRYAQGAPPSDHVPLAAGPHHGVHGHAEVGGAEGGLEEGRGVALLRGRGAAGALGRLGGGGRGGLAVPAGTPHKKSGSEEASDVSRPSARHTPPLVDPSREKEGQGAHQTMPATARDMPKSLRPVMESPRKAHPPSSTSTVFAWPSTWWR